MTTHYLDLDFRKEKDAIFLMERTFRAVHSFLDYELGDGAARQSRMAVAFPRHMQHADPGENTVLRVFASEADLKKLLRYPPILRFTAEIVTQIKVVPACDKWIRYSRFRQVDHRTPSTVRREQARGYVRPTGQTGEHFTLGMQSASTSQEFCFRIRWQEVSRIEHPIFNSYGLAIQGGVAKF